MYNLNVRTLCLFLALISYIKLNGDCSKLKKKLSMEKLKTKILGRSPSKLSSGEEGPETSHKQEEETQGEASSEGLQSHKKKKKGKSKMKGCKSHEDLQELIGKKLNIKNTKTILSKDKEEIEKLFSDAYAEEIRAFTEKNEIIVPTICKPSLNRKDICALALGHSLLNSDGIKLDETAESNEYVCSEKKLTLYVMGEKGQIGETRLSMMLLQCPFKKITGQTEKGFLSLAEGAGPDSYFVFKSKKRNDGKVSFKWHLAFRRKDNKLPYASLISAIASAIR